MICAAEGPQRPLDGPNASDRHGASAAGRIHDDGDRFASGQRLPSRHHRGCNGCRHEVRSDLRGLQLWRAVPGLGPRWKLQHSFALPLLVTHGNRHAAPPRHVTGPLGLALKPPDISLACDLDLKLGALLGSCHVRQLARQAPPSHPAIPRPRLRERGPANPSGLSRNDLPLARRPMGPSSGPSRPEFKVYERNF